MLGHDYARSCWSSRDNIVNIVVDEPDVSDTRLATFLKLLTLAIMAIVAGNK